MKHRGRVAIALVAALLAAGCSGEPKRTTAGGVPPAKEVGTVTGELTRYVEVPLTADLSGLTEKERAMVPILTDACREMDAIFWKQAYGDREALLAGIADPELRRFAEINYGPWDRLRGNAPFVPGTGPKPPGAGFYPTDMTKEEFDRAAASAEDGGTALRGAYTVVRRDPARGLVAVPYREAYAENIGRAAAKLDEAAALAEDPGLKTYLTLRAQALRTDDYRPSDVAWMDMKNNAVDVVIGPIENYEDALFGIRAAHEGFVLVKDRAWSARLARYAALLPQLQRELPVPDAYKRETPGTGSDLNAYDAVFYAGDCNAGSKTIAINLPNDETVQLEKGTRRLQLKNAMRAKFENILMPIADLLVAEDQRRHIKFDAFFANVMFHEVAHGLGIKNLVAGSGTVREALKEQYGALEEGKADVLGLYMVTKLHGMGEIAETDLIDHYVTFMAGIFRSVRFGASSAHGRANLAQFGFLAERGAFSRDPASGTWRVDMPKMQAAVDALAAKILNLQGDGDYAGSLAFLPKDAAPDATLQADLSRLAAASIPTDIVWRQ